MKEYRTTEQFEEILDSIGNGNWMQGAGECVEYGFYANDLLNALEALDYMEECSQEWCTTVSDLVLLIEMASKIRYGEGK